ncbi:MAG: hypothetical protein F9K40_04945 [Kofleriaceae bacterium]|nr:MAG: hypothetical protein F9K40_04945 [Kofleriaceae bacterium]
MLRYRTQGLLAVGLGVFAGGCFGDPEIRTDLRTEGPPQILAAMSQSLVTAIELPFFCRYVGGVKDEKAPGFVIDYQLGNQLVCPDDPSEFVATDMDPRGYGLRVMFDELLDGDAVETLICEDNGVCAGSLLDTQPVTVTCGASNTPVAYDGYYTPNGNNTTYPLGPSIVIVPGSVDFATGTDCTVTMGANVRDKSGETVPAAEASLDFRIADLAIEDTDPHDAEEVDDRTVLDPDGAVGFAFNAYIDEATIDAADFEIVNTDTDAVIPSDFAVDGFNVAGDAIFIFGAADLPAGNYTARLKSGAVIGEVNGGTITLTADEDVRFVVE